MRNPDILASGAALKDAPFTVGFAAETEATRANAKAKLKDNGLDLIVANTITSEDNPFGSDRNRLLIIDADSELDLGYGKKTLLDERLVIEIARHYRAKHPTTDT